MFRLKEKTIAIVCVAALGATILVAAPSAFADTPTPKAVKAYNISLEGNEFLKDGYISQELWEKDKQQLVEEIEKLKADISGLSEYTDDAAEYDNLDTANVKHIEELEGIRDEMNAVYAAAKQKKQEALVAKQKQLEQQKEKQKQEVEQQSQQTQQSQNYHSGGIDLRSAGVVNWGGYRFTWYSQNVLPGGGLSIPGRHVNGAGFVCDGEGYIVAATALGRGTTGDSPWGAWRSYDTGVSGNTVDLYCNW